MVNQQPNGTAWSADGTRVAVGVHGSLAILDGAGYASQQWIFVPGTDDARAKAWSPDGTRLAVVAYLSQKQKVDLLIVAPQSIRLYSGND